MNVNDAIKKRRSIRRFKQEKVSRVSLRELLDSARLASSGGNMQKLRYIVIETEDIVKKVFEQTAWGGHVKPKRNPEWGVSAPLTFILLTASDPTGLLAVADASAAIQNMQLKATAMGLGCCWIGAFKAENVSEILELPEDIKPVFLLAIGVPDESPLQEDIENGDDTKYYLDDDDRLHVPKLTVDSLTQWV